MAKIKTKQPSSKSIKVFDKASTINDHTRDVFIRSKDQMENLSDDGQVSPSEYAEDKVKYMAEDTLDSTGKAVKKGTRKTADRIKESRAKNQEAKMEAENPSPDNSAPDDAPKKNASKKKDKRKQTGVDPKKKDIKTRDRMKRTIKQTNKSTGKATVKTQKAAVKSSQKAVKTTEKTAKTAIKTAEKTAKATQKAAKASAKAAQRTAQATKAAVKATIAAVKVAAKAVAAAVKAIIAGTKALIAAIAAGGWVAVIVVVVICLIGLIVGSVFAIFFSSEDTGSEQTMQAVVQEINNDYESQINTIKNDTTYDVLEMSGSRAVWKEVLAVYSVKVNTDSDNPQEVATMDASKKATLKEIFWAMNNISSRTASKTEKVITETDDGNGNITTTEEEKTRTYLYISVTHKTADEMATQYGFSDDQEEQLHELLLPKYDKQWSVVLYGISYFDDAIVSVALSQIGNEGGQPYWSWYGFGSRVEWCACFVSWCANECGYIDNGIIPKFAGCVSGSNWFKERGQWQDRNFEPTPGTIIFFDWDNKGSSGPQDGLSDHVGIVKEVKDGIVYTVEGNTGDACRERQYSVGYYEILGYGIPAY